MRVRREVLLQMAALAREEPEIECCGLLGGREGVTTHIFPAANRLHSATRYEIAPEELFRIFREMRREGLKLSGIYHSHPRNENVPSATDIEQFGYPEAACVILRTGEDGREAARAFRIAAGRFDEMEIEVVE